MNTDPLLCSACGTVLDASAPGGLCPRCLLAGAMQPTEPAGTNREPPSLAEVGAAFPQLEIVALVGQGGMGWVFKARQPKLNRLVALKLLPASLAERDAAFAGRFEREGQLLARLHHPNIVAVHDSGAAGGFFYLLMEFVEGVNLRQAMRSARFTPAQALAIVPHICDALQFAHDEGVLHRDIKPENILLDGKGRVKLADFGIAKLMGDGTDETHATHTTYESHLTQTGTTLGTPSYMAPEQRDTPADVGHRADIYSLGVVFYELLTGELPVGKFALPSEISASDPRVDAIVRQALEKERDRRQSSAGEVKTQVQTLVASHAAAEPTGAAPAPQKPAPASAENEAEWRNPANWTGPVYFSKRDSRVWVPKQNTRFGWTVNFGQGRGLALIAGLLVAALIISPTVTGYFVGKEKPRAAARENASRLAASAELPPPQPAAPAHAGPADAFHEYEELLTALRTATFDLEVADLEDGDAAAAAAHRKEIEARCQQLAERTARLRERLLALGRQAAEVQPSPLFPQTKTNNQNQTP